MEDRPKDLNIDICTMYQLRSFGAQTARPQDDRLLHQLNSFQNCSSEKGPVSSIPSCGALGGLLCGMDFLVNARA